MPFTLNFSNVKEVIYIFCLLIRYSRLIPLNLIPSPLRRRFSHRPNLLSVADNIGWLFFDRLLRMGLGVVISVWVARYLGPREFGVLSYALAFSGIFATVAGLGLESVVVRDLVRQRENAPELLGTSMALLGAGALVAYGFCIAVGLAFHSANDPVVSLILVTALMIFCRPSDIVSFFMAATLQSRYVVWIQNSVFAVLVLARVSLIGLAASVAAFAWAATIEAVLAALFLLLVFNLRALPLNRLRFSFPESRRLIAESWPLFLSGLSIMIYMRIDQIMLGQMVGSESVGLYSAVIRISEVWYFIPQAIISSLFPAILRLKMADGERYREKLQGIFSILTLMSLVISILVASFSSTIVDLLYGQKYDGAASILAVHIWASVFVFQGLATSQWYIAENMLKASLYRTTSGAVVNVVMNLFLLPKYGALGAAYATVISYGLSVFVLDYFQERTRLIFMIRLKAFNPMLAWTWFRQSL